MSGISERRGADPQLVAISLRVLGGDLGATHLWFDQRVLDRYREQSGWRVMRTNTVGRLRSPDGWSLDFGIADADGVLHSSATELSQRLPAPERQHWAQHVVAPTASRNFLSMRLAPGSCIDDGELRDWPAPVPA
ncbi:MAG: hypothetical protein JO057_13380 [Chloroflexi bacterium]|nr:hypothetical protein [Chloroflexota bacterium]